MEIGGGCHCGRVRFTAAVDPQHVGVCHCTDCQSLTGSAFRVTVSTGRDRVRLTGEPPRIYEKLGDSGRKRLQYFCPDCGSPLFVTGEGEAAETWGIRWGAIRERDQLVPSRAMWTGSAAPWLDQVAGLPDREAE